MSYTVKMARIGIINAALTQWPRVSQMTDFQISQSPIALLDGDFRLISVIIIIIIMCIYHALINALNAHMIHINLNTIFYTHVEHSPTKTIYIKYYLKR